MEIEQEKYFNQNKKIYMFQLNHAENENKKNKINNIIQPKPKNIKYSFVDKLKKKANNLINNVVVEDVDSDNDYYNDDDYNDNDDYDDEYDENNLNKSFQTNLSLEIPNRELYHLNINHLDDNNNWNTGSDNFYLIDNESQFIKSLKSKYLDESNEIKKDCDSMYKIISETQKIKLGKGCGGLETPEKLICLVELNKNKLYSGITDITILTDPFKYQIESIKITAKAKNSDFAKGSSNLYREIEWDLEFEPCDEGYMILGLDHFIHIGLVGLEEVFFDIVYTKNITDSIKAEEIPDLDQLGWLKFTRCYYNKIIRTNLEKNLYLNEESYSVDIVDWIYTEIINIDLEEKKFGHIYNTNYNILRIMSGMSGLAYSN